jgi:hypothetical protein
MAVTIVVIDGMGGGIGAQLASRAREALGADARIIALGTNSNATERMLKSGADKGASGDNAVRASVGLGDFILGPIGIIVPNGLMGEISPAMATAISEARGERILLPVQQTHFFLAGFDSRPIPQLVNAAIDILKQKIAERV